jgi:hypothetical protein
MNQHPIAPGLGALCLTALLSALGCGPACAYTAGSALNIPTMGGGNEVLTASGYDPATSVFLPHGAANLYSTSINPIQATMTGSYGSNNYILNAAVTYDLAAPLPSVTTTAGFTSFGIGNSILPLHATGELDYSFTLTGPGPASLQVPVVLQIGVQMHANSQLIGTESNSAHVILPGGGQQQWSSNGNASGVYPFAVLMHPGQTMTFGIYAASFETNLWPGLTSTATSIIDSNLYVDPTYADAGSYHINVEAGINNSPVPEPMSAMLWAAGGLALGWRVRRQLVVLGGATAALGLSGLVGLTQTGAAWSGSEVAATAPDTSPREAPPVRDPSVPDAATALRGRNEEPVPAPQGF